MDFTKVTFHDSLTKFKVILLFNYEIRNLILDFCSMKLLKLTLELHLPMG